MQHNPFQADSGMEQMKYSAGRSFNKAVFLFQTSVKCCRKLTKVYHNTVLVSSVGPGVI